MNPIRMTTTIAVALLMAAVLPSLVSAEKPQQSAQEQKAQAVEAQHQTDRFHFELQQALQQREQSEERFRNLKREYERAMAIDAEMDQHGQAHSARREAEMREMRLADQEKELHDLRVQAIELQAQLENREVSGEKDNVEALQRHEIELQRRMQMAQLELDRQHMELGRVQERREIGHMQERLEFVEHWRDVAFDPAQAITMATQSIVEMHMGDGQPAEAVSVLEELLEDVHMLGARTALRFALKELYSALDNQASAQTQMTQVILENARANTPTE